MNKKVARLRRARKTRAKIAGLGIERLSVFRSNNHIYAQIISAEGDKVLAQASTVETAVRGDLKSGSSVAAAQLVGSALLKLLKLQALKRLHLTALVLNTLVV